MKKKIFIVQMLDSKNPSGKSFTQVNDALFYSNDTDAHLVFLPHEQERFEFNEATVALYNIDDGSLVERPAVIETFEGRKSVVLKMTEDLLAHWGRWQAQVVFKQGDKINTSVVVKFDTLRYMLDQRPPTLRDVIKVDELYSQLVTVMDEIAGKDVISAPEIILARGGKETLGERLSEEFTLLSSVSEDLQGRGVNAKALGFKLDGRDEGEALNAALIQYRHIFIPQGSILGTTVPIRLRRSVTLIGGGESSSQLTTPVIKWIGDTKPKESVVIIGNNLVGAEPEVDGSSVVFRNFIVDGDYKAGIGVYGTYLTNETSISNIQSTNALEYAMYFARAWYASFYKLLAKNNNGCGIAFGMPLEFSDGDNVNWTTQSPLEMNNCQIEDIRSIGSGRAFSVDSPNTWSPLDPLLRRKGYGIGAGIGNGFILKNFLSERSGGVNLYVYTGPQSVKSISSGYLENSSSNSGLGAADRGACILEHTSPTGGTYELKDIFINPSTGGGIYHVGAERRVKLVNIHQPRFLKSIDGKSDIDLYSFIIKDNVYSDAGYINTDTSMGTLLANQVVDTSGDFSVDLGFYTGHLVVEMKLVEGTLPNRWGYLTRAGTIAGEYTYPSDLSTSEFKRVRILTNSNIQSLLARGTPNSSGGKVEIRITAMPLTFR